MFTSFTPLNRTEQSLAITDLIASIQAFTSKATEREKIDLVEKPLVKVIHVTSLPQLEGVLQYAGDLEGYLSVLILSYVDIVYLAWCEQSHGVQLRAYFPEGVCLDLRLAVEQEKEAK